MGHSLDATSEAEGEDYEALLGDEEAQESVHPEKSRSWPSAWCSILLWVMTIAAGFAMGVMIGRGLPWDLNSACTKRVTQGCEYGVAGRATPC